MSFNSLNHRNSLLAMSAVEQQQIEVRTSTLGSRLRSPTGRSFLLVALLAIVQVLFPHSAQSADLYRALYYNASGKLLQVEEVPDAVLATRTLQDPSAMPFPTLTKADFPLVQGPNKKMSKFATIAVYYTYTGAEPATNAPNIQAYPVKVEDLQWVSSRTLAVCLPRYGTAPCPYPKRCHCMTGGCCCY